MTASSLTIKNVSDKAVMKDFLGLPERLYADDPHWVAPLKFEQKQRFSDANHFFEHARWAGFVA